MLMWFLLSFVLFVFFCLQLGADWEAISKTRASCFIGVSKHSKTIKALGLRPRAFISFLVFGNPDETLALVFEILLLTYHIPLQQEVWLAAYSRSHMIGVTYIITSLTHSSIDPCITYPDAPTMKFFFQKKSSKSVKLDKSLLAARNYHW